MVEEESGEEEMNSLDEVLDYLKNGEAKGIHKELIDHLKTIYDLASEACDKVQKLKDFCRDSSCTSCPLNTSGRGCCMLGKQRWTNYHIKNIKTFAKEYLDILEGNNK